MVLRGRLCDIAVLNAHIPTEEKLMTRKGTLGLNKELRDPYCSPNGICGW